MKKSFTISAILISSLMMQQANAQMHNNNKNSGSYNTNKTIVVNPQSFYQQDKHNSRGNVGQMQESNRYSQAEMHDNRDAKYYSYNNHNEHYNRERQDDRYRENEIYHYNHYNHYEGHKW